MAAGGLILKETIALAGEVLVNLGGEPERDDSGLPPVDIEVPDDARELDRDVQAYRRELRALRRQQRRIRLHRPLTRDGVVLPLLASCLVLALIAGTLLTVFTAGPGGDLPAAPRPTATAGASNRPATSPPASPPDSPTAVPARNLPDKAIKIDAKPTALRGLTPAVLALVPVGCNCVTAIRQLVRQAGAAGVALYLVSAKGHLAALRQLAAREPGPPRVAEDYTGTLYAAYPPTGLTAVLAGRDGSVTVAASLPPAFRLTAQLDALQATSAGASTPAATARQPPTATPRQPAATPRTPTATPSAPTATPRTPATSS